MMCLVDVEFSECADCAVEVAVFEGWGAVDAEFAEVPKIVPQVVDASAPFFAERLDGLFLSAKLCRQHTGRNVVQKLVYFRMEVVL